MQAIPKINVKDLKPHPQNTEIYGEEDVKELAEKIKESGWIKPIVIAGDGTVISGHRRLKACQLLGIKEVEYEAVYFNNKNEELERLLLENQSRNKTNEQKIREGLMWEEVIKEKAKLRMSLGGQGKENFPTLEKGQTRDIVAEKIDMGSGKNYDNGKKVVKTIDELKEKGKEKEAQVLSTVFEKSVNGAKDLLKTDLTKVDEDLKDKVISGEIPPKEAVKEIKKEMEVEKTKEQESNVTQNSAEREMGETRDIETPIVTERESKELQEKIIENIENKISIIPDNIISDFEVDKNNFIKNMSKYIELEETFEEISQQEKEKNQLMDCIQEMEEVINKIKEFLY